MTHDHYRMNPDEDIILSGDELEEGMRVLAEQWTMRSPHDYDPEGIKRREEFRTVTRLEKVNHLIIFLGEWADGYQESHTYAKDYFWLVKKEKPQAAVPMDSESIRIRTEDALFLERFKRLYPEIRRITMEQFGMSR